MARLNKVGVKMLSTCDEYLLRKMRQKFLTDRHIDKQTDTQPHTR